jgi:hypothetical protein
VAPSADFPLVLVFVRDTLLDSVVFIDNSGRIVRHSDKGFRQPDRVAGEITAFWETSNVDG